MDDKPTGKCVGLALSGSPAPVMPLSRRLFVPETVQTSEMDCGPAALSSLLSGHRIEASYPRLREACHTEVDGTSISTLAEVAGEMGLVAEEILVPRDHLLLPRPMNLPALVVVKTPSGNPHFVVAWRLSFGRVQIMDPASGRRFVGTDDFAASLYEHVASVPASDWREYAGSDDFQDGLSERLRRLRVSKETASRLRERSCADPGWLGIARADAATRCADSLVRAGALRPGAEVEACLEAMTDEPDSNASIFDRIPRSFWIVTPAEDREPNASNELLYRGALLVAVRGVDAERASRSSKARAGLERALSEGRPRPGRRLLDLVRPDGFFAPAALALGTVLASAGLLAEGLLFRGLLELSGLMSLPDQRLKGALALLGFLLVLFLVEVPVASGLLRMGRRLETRLRLALHEKLPRLFDHYFRTRLVSDTVERAHVLHTLRALPTLGARLIRDVLTAVLIAAAVAWWIPERAALAAVLAAVTVLGPLVALPLLMERSLRVRTHEGSLAQFYLDGLCGLVPLKTHGAGRSLRAQHERMMVSWSRAKLSLLRAQVVLHGAQYALGYGLAAAILVHELSSPRGSGAVLLLAYWTLTLPSLGTRIAALASELPGARATALRLLEPLDAPERPASRDRPQPESVRDAGGVGIEADAVAVRVSSSALLEDVSFRAAPGEHVAVVGASGAGKSTLFGLLLGWHEASSGRLLVDGRSANEAEMEALRHSTAWVDPAVQLWNRTMLHNLAYGSPTSSAGEIAERVHLAQLDGVLQSLPHGLRGGLGESGALVSGGEGQRVRLARALGRGEARLVLLDEPFRGLERARRRRLLERARAHWRRATLLCATHDISHVLDFDRVLVMEQGRIVESGPPELLRDQPGSRFRAMLEAEKRVTAAWSSARFRRWRLREPTREESLPREDAL